MSEQSLELLRRIRERLSNTARRMTMADLCFGVAVSIGIASTMWALTVALEAGFWFDTTIRTVLFWSTFTGFAGLFAFFVLQPLLRLSGVLARPTPQYVAHRIGARFPEIGDRLVNLLDLSEGRRSDAPDTLVDGAVRMLGGQVERIEFEKVETFSRARRTVRLAAIPLASLLLFLAAAPGTFVDASKRLFSPGMAFEAPAPFRLIVEPGDHELSKGASMDVSVRADGEEQPRTIILSLNNLDEEHVEEVRLSVDSAGVFRHRLANVRRSFRYRAVASPVSTDWYRTEVTEHPLIRNMQVTLHFPAYSGLPPQRLDPNVGDVSALPGSTVNLDLEVGGSTVDEAFVSFDDGTVQSLDVNGEQASGSFRLMREGEYRIVVKNRRGVPNRDPIAYTMKLITDASPSIVLLHPEPDSELQDDLRSLLVARLNDDFGFRDLRLHYRLAESRFGDPTDEFEDLDVALDSPSQIDQEVRFDWELTVSTDLDPVPGDVIEYYLEVRDNDAYAGFKSARTPLHRLRLPSLAEKYEQVEKEQNEVEGRMEEMMRSTDQIRDQFRELRDELRRKQDADWEDERQLEQIQERQRRLEQKTDQLSEQMESMNRSMERNDLLSEETLDMYREMQKVVEEINSPELMEALRKLQESIEELNLQQLQQAVEDVEFNEEQYRQRLERALELFKNLRTQQALEEAARRAEELAKQQERFAEETKKLIDRDKSEEAAENGENDEAAEHGENGDSTESKDREGNSEQSENDERIDGSESEGRPSDGAEQKPLQTSEKLAGEQERSKEEMERLEQLLEQIREQMDELRKAPSQDMQQLNEAVQQQQIPQQMQENADQLRRQELQPAQKGQQQMQQQLQQLQSQLSEMQSGMQGRQMEMNMAGLRRALSDVLTLSQKQEELRGGVRNTASESPSLREDARRQVELSEGLATVIDTLRNLSKNVPQMSREVQRQAGEAVRQMSRSTEAMTERSVDQAAGHQKASMMHLNELALMLSEVMNQLMNASGSGSGSTSMQQMIQQLQDMAGQQEQLNQQIQQFLNDAQGNRLSVEMQERLQQMSSQQEAIKRQLDQLRRNPESRGKLLGDLDKIGQQMEETITELQRRQVDPKMVERQRQILQRLLDAQKSIHERGEKDEREGREGRDAVRQSPDALPPQEAVDRLRRDLLKALESGYAPDYEELIKRYFELLQNETLERD